ncbi:MAG: NUDIX domain-containing protein [Patescibacteria group bacterium]
MKKIFFILIHPVRRLYWFIMRPHTQGVKGIVFFENMVLMIRNSYGRGHWTLPGGRVKRKEPPLDAVKREIKEETGITIDQYHLVVTYKHVKEYKRDTVSCFAADTDTDQFKIDPSEVKEARWFPVRELPDFISPNIKKFVVPFIQAHAKK